MNFVGTPVPEGVWAAGSPSALDYLLRLAQERIELANSGLPGARNQGDAIAMVQRDLAHHHIKVSSALRQKHLKCYGTDDELARMQVEAMNNVLAQVTEISLFWDIHEAVPGRIETQSDISSSSEAVFSATSEPSQKSQLAIREEPARYNSRLFDNSNQSRPGPSSAQLPMHPSVQRYWQLQDQISQAKSDFEDALSQRSRTPSHAHRQLQDQAAEIEALRAQIDTLETQQDSLKEQMDTERRNHAIEIRQKNEAIRVQSQQISGYHNRPQKFESQPFLLPREIANAESHDYAHAAHSSSKPKQIEYPNYPQTTSYHPQSASRYPQGHPQQYGSQPAYNAYNQHGAPSPGFGARSSSILPTKWGPLCNNNPLPDPFRSPQNQARIGADPSGSPIPIDRMRSLNIKEGTMAGGGNRNISTPPRQQQELAMREGPSDTPYSARSHSSDAYCLVPRVPNQTPARTASQASSSGKNNSGALVPVTGSSKEAKMTQSFQALHDEVVRFAYRHINVPSTHGDSNAPQYLKDRLMELATTTTAHRIMSNQNTRYFLIAKLILAWFLDEVFQEAAFAGFDSNIDNAVRNARSKIFHDTPPSVRKVLLQEIAKNFSTLKNNVEFEQWKGQRCHKRALELWDILKNLMYVKSNGDWDELHTLVTNAHKLALSMLSDEAEFRFEFPRINTLFNEFNMFNMDPDFRHYSTKDIMARGGLVRLGALPQVMVRVTAANGNTTTKPLIKAGVLIMFPKTNEEMKERRQIDIKS
ncbi:hypothetical protein PMZ80_002693 [Knufia obscura]|uniref:Uncharacterized protein n=1 Tax=Knufia obscura TaxID=1635080 RepID=A0ABR0RYY5_9EURO|nr:hypothetical protein PMZ80_002693 [Knufia obscura]